MKRKSIFLIALFAMCICFSFNVYANEGYEGQGNIEVTVGVPKTVEVDSTDVDSYYMSYGIFTPKESGFYDLTIQTADDVRVDFSSNSADKVKGVSSQSFSSDGTGKWENVCYCKANENYTINFMCFKKGVNGRETKATVTYTLSKNTSEIKKLTDNKVSVEAKKDSRNVFSYETGSQSGMYSLIFDNDKRYAYTGYIVKQSEVDTDWSLHGFSSYAQDVNGSYDVKLDAKTKYYIIYSICDENVKTSDTIKANVSAKRRDVKSAKLELASDIITSVESISDKEYKFTVTYSDGDVRTTQKMMNSLSYIKWDDADGYDSKYNGTTVLGNHQVSGSYWGKKFKTTVNVKSAYQYAKEHGKVLTPNKLENVGAVTEYIGYYTFTPSKDGWYITNGVLDNYLRVTTNLDYIMIDSKDKEVKYVDFVGYKLKAKTTYVFYVNYKYWETDGKEFSFSLDYKEHTHKVVTDKAVAATYTHEGKTQGSHCSVCNEVIVAQKKIAKKQLVAPKLTSLASKSNGVAIKWNKSKDATGYIVYRKTGKSGKYTRVATLNSKTLSYTDKGVKKSRVKKTYYYTLRATRTEKVSKKNVTVSSNCSNAKSIKR